MRKGLILSGLGVAVWAVPTLFFALFGKWVVLEVGEAYFGSSLFLLEMLTFLLLIGIALIVRLRLLRERGSATHFGFVAAVIGLLLNTYTAWHRDSVFPSFTEGQHQAYTVWMSLAYALTLIVPAVVDRLVKETHATPLDNPEAPNDNEVKTEAEQPSLPFEAPPTSEGHER
ncbi:hypothetical protein D7Z26_10805 [Cohnella endophytica]|uniref:Uncharacterized protein n=1 Tax=Cohnella endophytica TaxID=2419778 RepID=A0A494XTE3_9BACL|nr:hypothetical protein [Cohnella endophytica]RKP53878.1 hypothetical protein D7Z26_10805 [Cohnella endophytica]